MTEEEIRQENSIVQRAKKDPRAFGTIYDKYFDRIFTFIFRQTDDEELSADLCSQTFLNALSNIGKFEFRGIPIAAWLYRIAGNEVNKHYRKARRDRIFSIEESRIKELFAQAEEPTNEELINRMVEFLKELPTEMLEVLQLRYFEDRNYQEIAYILNISESGAKMRVYRALDRLRRNFNLSIKYDGKK